MNSFLKYNWISIAWATCILVMCLIPGKDIPSLTIFDFDKIVHFLIYVVLAVLMFYGWKKQSSFPALKEKTLAKILFITFAYGFMVEVAQEMLTADRHFDLMDALANSGGAVAGSLLSLFLKNKLTN